MDNTQLKEMRSRIKILLAFYLPCLAVLALVCILMYHTTNYYAAAYPYSNINTLPHNSTTAILSVFNGYTEKVPQSANLTYIMQNTGSIRQSATNAVASTVEELLLAFVTLMMFSVFGTILEGWSGAITSHVKKLRLLPVVFLLSLLVSQYAIASVFLLHQGTLSGISFFFVDSLAIIVWFGMLDELILYRYARKASSAKAVKLLMVLWPPTLILISLLLLQNLGLFAYNASFAATYHVHFAGLAEFAILFALLYFWERLHAAVRRIRGSRGEAPMPRPRRGRERRRAK